MVGCTCESGPASAHSDDGHGNWVWYCPVHYVDNVNSGSGDQLSENSKSTRRIGRNGLSLAKRANVLNMRLATCYGRKPIQVTLRCLYSKARRIQ